MATLADELQNDFADSGSERGDEDENEVANKVTGLAPKSVFDSLYEEDEDDNMEANEDGDIEPKETLLDEAEEEEEARLQAETASQRDHKDMRGVASFMKSMEPILEGIKRFQSLSPEERDRHTGSIEDHAEYHLLTKSNSFSTSIDDEKTEVHKYIRDHYSARFPELETLLGDPIEYTRTVAVIGNGPMDRLKDLFATPNDIVKQPLNVILSRPKLMTVTVEATTSKGQPLPEAELEGVLKACRTMLRLEEAKYILTEYVQSRMNFFAPNLTKLIGSLTAAQLINARGGLTKLAETRASNLAAIGSKKAAHSGLATNVGIRSQGYLYQSDIIGRFRPELKVQAMRIVSAKIVLAARVDRVHQHPDGSAGEQLREDCEKRLDKLTEPPPNKGARALPAPDDKPSKKRGGRRARKAKEATAMTDIRKAQNRMAFGKEEQEVGYGTGEGTAGLGMIGQSNDGRVRALQIDQRTRAKLSKKNLGWGGTSSVMGGAASSLRGFGSGAGAGNASVLKGHGLRTSGVATSLNASAGTASSLAFTPKQGLELVDPKIRAEMERKARADQDKWFKGGTFTQVGGASAMPPPSKKDTGFKVPQLPLKRKLDNGESI